MTTNPWGMTPAAQAAQWSQQFGSSSVNPSWEIARKALEKLTEGSSESEGGSKESKSPEKKGDQESSDMGKKKKKNQQKNQPNMNNMYGNFYQPYSNNGGGPGIFPDPYGPQFGPPRGYNMPPPPFLRGAPPYSGMPPFHPLRGMYPPFGPRPPFGERGGPGFPPYGPRGPPGGLQPPPPPPPHNKMNQSEDASSPPPSSTPSSNPTHSSQNQVSEDGEGVGGGAGRGRGGKGAKYGFGEAPNFKPGENQLQTGSTWNKNIRQPSDSQGIRFSLPNKRAGVHPSPGGNSGGAGNQGASKEENTQYGNKKGDTKTQESKTQPPKKPTPASVNPSDWPPSLKDYVQRAFNSCQFESEKDKVEAHLKKILTLAHNEGTVMTKDWANEPLPFSPSPLPSKQPRSSDVDGRSPWGAGRGRGRGRGRGKGQWEDDKDRQPGRGYPNRMAEPARGRHGRKIFGFSRDDYSSDSGSSRSYSRSRSRSRSRGRSRSRSRSRSPRSRRRSRRYRDERDRSRSPNRDGFIPFKSAKKGKGRGRGRGRGRDRVEEEGKGGDRKNERTPGKKGQQKAQQKGQKGKKGNVGNIDYADERERSMRMQKRAARFQDMLGEDDVPHGGSKKQRTQKLSLQINEDLLGNADDSEWSMEPIVGTSKEISKKYLRLTSAPDPSQVRPVSVLRKSLAMVKERWASKHDYTFVCEQLKSIRQDLTVQCIRNEFCVEVYETHGRIALEKGDVPEFNQCQSQLKALYAEGIPGNHHEFLAYQILYHIYMENTMEINTALAHLQTSSRNDPSVKHALDLRSAWAMSDYNKFFKLYRTAPRMGPYLIDTFIARERKNAVKVIIKSFRPNITVEYITSSLAFEDNDACIAFLVDLGAVLTADRTKVDCKQSTAVMAS